MVQQCSCDSSAAMLAHSSPIMRFSTRWQYTHPCEESADTPIENNRSWDGPNGNREHRTQVRTRMHEHTMASEAVSGPSSVLYAAVARGLCVGG